MIKIFIKSVLIGSIVQPEFSIDYPTVSEGKFGYIKSNTQEKVNFYEYALHSHGASVRVSINLDEEL
jgi:hypothetical protein